MDILLGNLANQTDMGEVRSGQGLGETTETARSLSDRARAGDFHGKIIGPWPQAVKPVSGEIL